MSAKILVVDDSPTVQKVIAITLANEGHELFQALNEDELFNKLKTGSYNLILLDFTISPKKSGYDTVKQVMAQAPQTPILLLLGQFDQVDEQMLTQIGIQEKLLKPFDSARFIQRCRVLLESKSPDALVDDKKTEVHQEFSATNDHESWVVNSPKVEMNKVTSLDQTVEMKIPNALKNEMESWGIPVPSVIGNEAENVIEFPPIINSDENSNNQDEVTIPVNDDLAYPTARTDVSVEALTEATLSSKLIPMNELVEETDDLSFTDDQTERMDIPLDLTAELESETQSENVEDFWMADIQDSDEAAAENNVVSVSSVDLSQPHIEAEAIGEEPASEVKVTRIDQLPKEVNQLDLHVERAAEFQVAPQIDKEELIRKIKESLPEINEEEIFNKLKKALPPIVEQYMKDYCEKTVERVAWEIIPDLAENLIRRELRSLAESVPRE